MRLWTVQSKDWVGRLNTDGKIRCDKNMILDSSYMPIYDWMSNQMRKRLGCSYCAESPIWAWAILDGKSQRPDLRRMEFSYYEYPSYLLEIEVPEAEVLPSDEEDWNNVISDILNGNAEDNWERIFDLKYPDGSRFRFVQACLMNYRRVSWQRALFM